jgi:regulator of sirC expression with transglutaminase-like and TPR domain
MEVARGAGFEALGVGLPGHFVVRLDYEDRRLLVDPFRQGEVITEEDCRDLVTRSTGRPALFRRDLLEGTTPVAMLIRLLENLKRIYLAQRDYDRALAAVDRLLLAAPDEPSELRDRGFVLAHLGQTGAALADLEAYLVLHPGAPDADAVRDRVAWLQRRHSKTK